MRSNLIRFPASPPAVRTMYVVSARAICTSNRCTDDAALQAAAAGATQLFGDTLAAGLTALHHQIQIH